MTSFFAFVEEIILRFTFNFRFKPLPPIPYLEIKVSLFCCGWESFGQSIVFLRYCRPVFNFPKRVSLARPDLSCAHYL